MLNVVAEKILDQQDAAAGLVRYGYYTTAIIVMDKDDRIALDNVQRIATVIRNSGFNARIEAELVDDVLAEHHEMIVERVGYRPLRDAPRASAAITGLMIGIILETGNLILLGAQRYSFPSLVETTTYALGGVFVTNKKIMIVLVSITLSFALHQFIRHTRWGMAMRAMAFDYVVVPLMGVPLNRIAALTFAIGSGLAAVAGILFGVAYPVLDPYMGILIGWKAFVAAILGGRGSVVGATLAGFLLGFIEMFVPMVFPSTFRDLIAYSIILLILVFRPHGFFGEPYSAKLRL